MTIVRVSGASPYKSNGQGDNSEWRTVKWKMCDDSWEWSGGEGATCGDGAVMHHIPMQVSHRLLHYNIYPPY